VHQQVAADLKVTASEAEDAVTVAKSAGDSARSIFLSTTEIVKGLDGLNVVSGAVVAAGVALSSVATGGAALAVWGPLLVAGEPLQLTTCFFKIFCGLWPSLGSKNLRGRAVYMWSRRTELVWSGAYLSLFFVCCLAWNDIQYETVKAGPH
jgi:hypothetical protein